jgi:cell wall-associated NlpC family hydrolase
MRRMVSVVVALFAAVFVVSLSTLSAQAQPAEQYGPSDGTEAPNSPQESTAPDEPTSGASSSAGGFVSQGSATEANSPEAVAAQEDLAEEDRLPAYSQVVDNTTKGGFRAQGWKVERGGPSHGGSYASAGPGKTPARFEVKVPTTNDYSVYAWWPGSGKNGSASRFGVQTASGTKWSEVDQRVDGGMWVKVGTYSMQKGQRYISVAAKSAGGGRVVADAVALVRGEAAPPEQQGATASGQKATTADSKAAGRFTGPDVVRQARRHIGDRYSYGSCSRSIKSCTCLTRMAVQPFGHAMGMTENGQWNYGGSVRVPKSRLRPGDEVFFKEGGSRYITHVGIYAGNGRIVHASSYWGKVVEKEMKYISGYFGAKRFRSR